MKVKGKVKGDLEIKRFHLPGIVLSDVCSSCGESININQEDDYSMDSIIGEPQKITLWCEGCDNEMERTVQVDIKVKVIPSQEAL